MSGTTWWVSQWLATDAPALPAAWLMQAGMVLGWALVLACLGSAVCARFSRGTRRAVAVGLALWTLLPGPLTPDYWLGLAFHAPSLTATLLCGWWLWRQWAAAKATGGNALAGSRDGLVTLLPLLPLVLLVLLGYALLLDTFAVLPLQVYGWGFSPLLLLVLLALSLLPWLLRGRAKGEMGDRGAQSTGCAGGAAAMPHWLLPAALLLFAATRLPTGNVWDALLDPWLWLLFQGLLLRALFKR